MESEVRILKTGWLVSVRVIPPRSVWHAGNRSSLRRWTDTPHPAKDIMADNRLRLVKDHLAPAPKARLEGKVCIITGAGSLKGIGRAAAFLYAINGARAVYVCDFDGTNLEALCKELKSKASAKTFDAIPKEFDAADEDKVQAVVDEAITKFGRLDVYFANAGRATGAPLAATDGETFTETMRINGLSVFLAIRIASEAMQKTSKEKPYSSGSIIATASVAGLRSGAGSVDYSASKAAVVSMAQSGSWQLRGTNVRVNALCPGLIETGMTEVTFDMARERGTINKVGQLNPMLRYGVASEIAQTALFLATDEASYVNGQAWAVDGGLSASHPVVPGKFH